MSVRLRSMHHDATAAAGAVVARLLTPGDVVVLGGPLGAGKTRLVQGIAVGLGVRSRVTSPTFVLVRRHEGRLPLVHVDAYRLEDAHALATLDDDVLADDVVTCVEWGSRVGRALPEARLDIELHVDGDEGGSPRTMTLSGRGAGWVDRMDALDRDLAVLAGERSDLTVELAVDPGDHLRGDERAGGA